MGVNDKITSTHVCPVEGAGGLDMRIRKWFHHPKKIFSSYITPDMQVLDVGCGPGFFAVEIAKLLDKGHITAVDLQQGMLDKVNKKIAGTSLEKQITLHKCESNSLNLSKKFDFAFSFWVIHEIPDKQRLFSELKSLMNKNGKILIVEPKIHSTKKYFAELEQLVIQNGFEIIETPKIFFSRAILIQSNVKP
jgi:ubiquinone/menaquinone biosynthesis C-methylase UbiE